MGPDKRPDSTAQIEQGGLGEVAAQPFNSPPDYLPAIGGHDIADFSLEGMGKALP